ncbi:helix-turn-helix transcriptional regulator [Providencia rettgeri]|nr:helix-turn-helix transcriptional regulator [Providencia rettgeri]
MVEREIRKMYMNQCTGMVLRKFRNNKGLSARELGSMIGMSQQQISRYENGKNQITLSILLDVLYFLDISIDQFYLQLKKYMLMK